MFLSVCFGSSISYLSEMPAHQHTEHGEGQAELEMCMHILTEVTETWWDAHLSGMLPWMAKSFLGKTSQQGEVVELLFM